MSWTTQSFVIKGSISLNDNAPDSLLAPVDSIIQEVTDHLRERIEALDLPKDKVRVEVW